MTLDYASNARLISQQDRDIFEALTSNFVEEVYSSFADDDVPGAADRFYAAGLKPDEVSYS